MMMRHVVTDVTVCVCVCVRACVRARARARVRACLRACVHACMHAACIHSTNDVEAIQEVQILSLSGFVVGIIFIVGDFYQL